MIGPPQLAYPARNVLEAGWPYMVGLCLWTLSLAKSVGANPTVEINNGHACPTIPTCRFRLSEEGFL
jgi:hypothetical protein